MRSKISINCERCAEYFEQKGYKDEFSKWLNIIYSCFYILLFIIEGFVVMCGYNVLFPMWLQLPPLHFCQAVILRLLFLFITYKITQEDFMDFSIYYKITKLVFRYKISFIMFVVIILISLII